MEEEGNVAAFALDSREVPPPGKEVPL